MSDVYLNEKYVGKIDDARSFANNLIKERREGKFSESVNVFHDEEFDSVYIDSSIGRARRPVIIVKDGKSLLTNEHMEKLKKGELGWDDLIKQGIIEYLDASEEENCLISIDEASLTNEHTHVEVAPITILGLTTSLVPYGNYDAASKLNGGSKNQKHALGMYVSNFLLRMDTDVSLLHSPQRPIVKSFMHDISNYEAHPSGQNVVIAEISYDGYNMEDAIVVNKSSIERGFARSTYFRPYNAEELRYSGGLIDEIGIPDKEIKGYKSEEDYKYLENDGVVFPGVKVKAEDVV